MSKIYNDYMTVLGPDAFIKGLNYNAKSVKLEQIQQSHFTNYYFSVNSERTNQTYSVHVAVDPIDKKNS